MSTNYEAFIERIKAVTNLEELATLEARYTRHYELGTITAEELALIDSMAGGRFAALFEHKDNI